MKLLILFGFFAVAASANEEYDCTPGTDFKIDGCNTCYCSDNGKIVACTEMSCLPDESSMEKPKYQCLPGTDFKIDCNTCTCAEDGKSVACTDMACPDGKPEYEWCTPGAFFKIDCNPLKLKSSKNSEDIKCIPLTNFLLDCNTCYCTKRGTIGWCTLKSCPKYEGKITYLQSPKATRAETCEPGSLFRNYCNSCKCSADGKTAACTLMACDENVWNQDGTMKI